MKIRPFSFLLFAVLLLSAAGTGIYILSQIKSPGFREFAEEKVGEFLGARVSIHDVRMAFLNKVAFSNLDIEPQRESGPYHVKIHEVTFEYDPLRLFRQGFRAPAAVGLESPEIKLGREIFPYSLFEKLNFSGAGRGVAGLSVKGGQIEYAAGNSGHVLLLEDFSGRFQPAGDGIMKARFRARMSGFMEGALRVTGTVDLVNRSHELILEFEGVDFHSSIPVPLDDLTGKILWKDSGFEFESVEAQLHGWQVNVSGFLRNPGEEPSFELKLLTGNETSSAPWFLAADFQTGVMEGQLGEIRGVPNVFKGTVLHEDHLYVMKELECIHGYRGKGTLHTQTGEFELELSKENRRFHFKSNLKGLDFGLDADLNHFRVYGMDLVTRAHLNFRHKQPAWLRPDLRFDVSFETDYFVLEYMPFDDLKGHFEISPSAIEDIEADWGEAFDLAGEVSLRQERPDADLTFRVTDYDFMDAAQLAGKSLPEHLEGILEGKLRVKGDLGEPEVTGDFSIKDGAIGKLKYDWGLIHFRGFYPYLRLFDSKVMRGRTRFALEGIVDLSLENIFHGVQVSTPEKYIIWKGWEANTHRQNRDLEIAVPGARRGVLAVRASSETDRDELTGQDSRENQSVLLGGRLKF